MSQQNRILFTVVGLLVFLVLLGPMLMGGMMGPGVIGRGMMGWGSSGDLTSGSEWLWGLRMGLGGLMMLAFWGVLVVGVVLFVRLMTGQPAGGTGPNVTEDPVSILRRRYAAGEIDQPTFERVKADLQNASSAHAKP